MNETHDDFFREMVSDSLIRYKVMLCYYQGKNETQILDEVRHSLEKKGYSFDQYRKERTETIMQETKNIFNLSDNLQIITDNDIVHPITHDMDISAVEHVQKINQDIETKYDADIEQSILMEEMTENLIEMEFGSAPTLAIYKEGDVIHVGNTEVVFGVLDDQMPDTISPVNSLPHEQILATRKSALEEYQLAQKNPQLMNNIKKVVRYKPSKELLKAKQVGIRESQDVITKHMIEAAKNGYSLRNFIDGMNGGSRNLYASLWRGETLEKVDRRGGHNRTNIELEIAIADYQLSFCESYRLKIKTKDYFLPINIFITHMYLVYFKKVTQVDYVRTPLYKIDEQSRKIQEEVRKNSVSISTFFNIWNKYNANKVMRLKKTQTGCKVCLNFVLNCKDKKIRQIYALHIQRAISFRMKYSTMRKRENKENEIFVSFDYKSKEKFPSCVLTSQEDQNKTQFVFSFFGIIDEWHVVEPEYVVTSDRYEVVIWEEIVTHLFNYLKARIEKKHDILYIQADNAAGQNKNQFILYILTFFQQYYNLDLIILNFMISGHTHFSPDRHFGIVHAKKARKDKIETVEDLIKCDNNIREETRIYKIKDFLKGKAQEFKGISEFSSFAICSESDKIKAYDYMLGDEINTIEKFNTSQASKEYNIEYIRNYYNVTRSFFESKTNFAELKKYTTQETNELMASINKTAFLSEEARAYWISHLTSNTEYSESRQTSFKKKESKQNQINVDEHEKLEKFEYVAINMEKIFSKLLEECRNNNNNKKKKKDKTAIDLSIEVLEKEICDLGRGISSDCDSQEVVDDEVLRDAPSHII